MPAGINEAFKSPFHTSNPSSQMYDVNSYTRSSSSTNSIRNEYYNSNQPTNYRIGDQTVPDELPLPVYQPSPYPQLHPYGQESPNVPSAGWPQPRYQGYDRPVSPQLPPFAPVAPCGPGGPGGPVSTSSSRPGGDDCDELIQKVLSNTQCRQMLRQLFNDQEPGRDWSGSGSTSIDP